MNGSIFLAVAELVEALEGSIPEGNVQNGSERIVSGVLQPALDGSFTHRVRSSSR
jgi:hypothetical protein